MGKGESEPVWWCPSCQKQVLSSRHYNWLPEHKAIDLVAERERLLRENARLQAAVAAAHQADFSSGGK